MPEGGKELVINTGPIIALVAAVGDLAFLQKLYSRIVVPREVCEEITVNNASRFAAEEFEQAIWLEKRSRPADLAPLLQGLLDRGEAAVIQVAHDEHIGTVCIDEPVGRRVARMSGLGIKFCHIEYRLFYNPGNAVFRCRGSWTPDRFFGSGTLAQVSQLGL